jgi:hypothetical protein
MMGVVLCEGKNPDKVDVICNLNSESVPYTTPSV